MLADVNFDGVPELLIFGSGRARIFTVLMSETQNSVEKFFLDEVGSYRFEDIVDGFLYDSFTLYQNNLDSSLAYKIIGGYGFRNERDQMTDGYKISHNRTIYMTKRETPLDNILSISSRVADYFIAVERDVYWNIIDKYFAINGLNVSEEELGNFMYDLTRGYTELSYSPVYIEVDWDHDWWDNPWANLTDSDIYAFLESYVPEITLFEAPQQHDSLSIKINEEPFHWLGKTPEELELLVGSFNGSMWYSGPLFKFGDIWFSFTDYDDLGDMNDFAPVGKTNGVFGVLSDIIPVVADYITVPELNILFEQQGDVRAGFNLGFDEVFDSRAVAMTDIIAYTFGGINIIIETNLAIYGDDIPYDAMIRLIGNEFISPTLNFTPSPALASPSTLPTSVSAPTSHQDLISEHEQGRRFNLFNYWSVGVILLLIFSLGILADKKYVLRAWVVPTFSLIVILINLLTH
jgi:hypothetical protein